MSNANLPTIYQLLDEAFMPNEIANVAFDLFPDVYNQITTGMDKDQQIKNENLIT